jgi:cytochrome c
MRRLRQGASWLLVALAAFAAGGARADGDPARGEQRFGDCVACHSTERDVNGVGPSLYGVFERKAGGLTDFRYSPALRRSGITWTVQALDSFIADPQKMVPANRMPYGGMPDAGDRADLISYLQKASK